MYPFERYMKKLKNYVRNKANPEGSIAEGYVAEEALTFSSYYFWDVTMKFNHPDRNVDCPPPTCQFQVFTSLCKSIGLQSVIRIDHQKLKKVIWYVLHNSPEIDTYRVKFKIEFPNKDMKEEFPGWFGKQVNLDLLCVFNCKNNDIIFYVLYMVLSSSLIRQRHINNDPGLSESSELFALACGLSQTPISVNSCVVNGVRYVVHSRDERRTAQNSDICSPGPDGEMYYGQLEQILEFSYLSFKTVLFRVKWFDTSNKGQDDPDVIHVENSSDLALSTSLNDLKIAALHIDGQSIDIDAPPDIIDIVDEDGDIIDEEDPIPHDLADSDDEDLVNLDINDGVNVMSADVARGHGDDGGGDDRPPPYQIPTGCGGCLGNRGHPKTQFGWQESGQTAYLPGDLEPQTQFDLHPHMEFDRWPQIYVGIQQHLQKIYNGKKAALKERHWVPDEDETYDVERIRRGRPSHISEVDWDAQILFWNDPKNLSRAVQNKQNRAKSKDEMLTLQGLGSNTSTGVPYTDDEIMAIVRKGKQPMHILGVGRVKMFMKLFRSDDKFSQMLTQLESQPEYGDDSGSGGCGDDEPGDDKDGDEDEEDKEDD
ncbi:retrotransposon gag domain, retroviral aspartyl protease [Tanacetum coccineum]